MNACAPVTCNQLSAKFPIAGIKVAEELKQIPYEGFENTWEWLGRLDKLAQELSINR